MAKKGARESVGIAGGGLLGGEDACRVKVPLNGEKGHNTIHYG